MNHNLMGKIMNCEFPCMMLVGNNVVNGKRVGKTSVLIVKFQDGKYYAKNGYSWKYAESIKTA